MSEQAFINGFVKRAADYGVSEAEAIEILEKQAIIGPMYDIGNLGVPSAIGALIGRYNDMDEDEAEEVHRTPYGLGKGLLIPGYTGYHIGRKYKADHVLRENLGEKRKQKRKTEEEKKKNL
jgi:hypothetical protein